MYGDPYLSLQLILLFLSNINSKISTQDFFLDYLIFEMKIEGKAEGL